MKAALRAGYLTALAALVAAMVAAPSAGATVTIPPGSIQIPTSGTFLYMYSQPGDYIGGGTEQLYTSADSTINGSLPQGGDYFSASVIQGPYAHWWNINIAAPAPSTRWSATVSGDNGRLGAGPATLEISVSGCELSCHSASASSEIRLNASR